MPSLFIASNPNVRANSRASMNSLHTLAAFSPVRRRCPVSPALRQSHGGRRGAFLGNGSRANSSGGRSTEEFLPRGQSSSVGRGVAGASGGVSYKCEGGMGSTITAFLPLTEESWAYAVVQPCYAGSGQGTFWEPLNFLHTCSRSRF